MTGVFARVRRMAQDLSGRSDQRLIALLAAQLECTLGGARLAEKLTSSELTLDQAHDRMRDLEHDGDEARARLITELGTVLSTPVDVEDLFRISRSVDDVLDNLRDFVRECGLYHPASLDFAHPLAQAFVEGLEAFQPAIDRLASPAGDLQDATFETRKGASQIRRLYQEQLGQLFERPVDAETLRRRELLRRMDVVGLRLGEAAAALADGALKRSR